MDLRSNYKSKLGWALIILPVVILTALVLRFSVHVPFWDQWEMVPLFQKHDTGTLGFNDFWAQHNEHRVLFPNLILYGLAQITHWDPYYEVVANLLLGFAILGGVVLITKRAFKPETASFMIYSIIASLLILSPAQSENWLWGWQVEWFLSVFSVVAAVWSLTKSKLSNRTFATAIAASTIASFSLANGMTIWPIGLFILFWQKRSRSNKLVWTGFGLTEVFLYYYHYINPGYEPSKSLWLHHPKLFLHYLFVYLGRPLGYDLRLAGLMGAIILILFATSIFYIWKTRKSNLNSLLPFIALAAYSLAAASLTSISRLGFGIDQAFSSRYTTISSLFTLSTIVICGSALCLYFKKYSVNKTVQRHAFTLLILAALGLVVTNYGYGIEQMRGQHSHLILERQCLQSAKSAQDSCLSLAYPNSQIVWERSKYLRGKHWGGY